MASLRAFAAAIVLTIATPAPVQARADAVARWAPLIAEASQRFAIPAAWIERVMRAESGGETSLNGRAITSPAGAMGLMQLMPGTWAEMRAALGLGPDPHDPRDNILAGTAYLRLMYQRFGYPGLFGAYNAGPSRYAAYLAGARALPTETRAYLATLAGPAPDARSAALAAKPIPPLFVIERGRPVTEEPALAPHPGGLFAVRSQR
jgi:soluble lytic murein transglycosylase-like protein